MFDTIHLRIRESELDTPISFKEEVACKIYIDKKKSTNNKIVGWLEHFRIEIFDRNLYIKGSLTKWRNGNNIHGIEFCEVKEALDRLSDMLGVSLTKARVTRIDIAQTFKMKYDSRLYLPKLSYLKGFGRSDIKTTSLYFSKESKMKNGENMQLLFYDKNVELRNSDGYPLVKKDLNLLRYELRIKKVKYTFKRDIHCFELFSEAFYLELIKLWYDIYNSIEKRLESLEEYYDMNFNGTKDLYETCVRLCILAFDLEKEIEIASKKKQVTAQNKSNVLKKIKEIKAALKKKCPKLSMIDELNEKVEKEYKRQIDALKNRDPTALPR